MQTKSQMTALMTVLALGAACVGQSAFAASDDVAKVTVQYADLNLSSPAGAQAMLLRIRHAANIVCGEQPTHKIDQAGRLYDQCVSQAISGGVRELNTPMVTALYSGNRDAAPTTLASAR
jgi:UrcA family protein